MISYIQCYILLERLFHTRKKIKYYLNQIDFKKSLSLSDLYSVLNDNQLFEIHSLDSLKRLMECVNNYISNTYSMGVGIITNPFDEGILYYKGNIELIDHCGNRIGVVGSRDIRGINIDLVSIRIKELVDCESCIVSGLAKGSDTLAHRIALSSGGYTIAVLPSSIKNIYPKDNRGLIDKILDNNGLVISQFGIDSVIKRYNFLVRNKLIVQLSKEMVVLTNKKSIGVLNTINHANRLNIPISYLE